VRLTHSRSQTLSLVTSYRVEYEMKLKELCESRNSNRKNLRTEKLNEIRFGKIAFEIWKLENFSLLE